VYRQMGRHRPYLYASLDASLSSIGPAIHQANTDLRLRGPPLEHHQPRQARIVEFFDPTEIENISMVSTVFQLSDVPKIKAQTHVKWARDYDPEDSVIGKGVDRLHL
jgi:hypothetical protein